MATRERLLQEAKDKKDAAKAEKAYNDASSTAPNPKSSASAAKGYKKGGMVDGIARRGKTKGTVVKMKGAR